MFFPSSVPSVSTTGIQLEKDGKWQHFGHFRELFGTRTQHLWCNLLTSASFLQSLSILFIFPPNNSKGSVETGVRNCLFIDDFRGLIVADLQIRAKKILLVIFVFAWSILIAKLKVWLQNIALFFCSVRKPLQVHWKRSLFTVPARVWDTSWAELSGPRQSHTLAELTEPRHCYGRRRWSTHAKARMLCIN